MGVEAHESFDHAHLVVFTIISLVELDPFFEASHERRFCVQFGALITVADAAAKRVEQHTLHRV